MYMESSDNSLKTNTASILQVAIPISLGIFVQFIVAFIDNYFVAQVDSNAMSAASFVGLIYITLVMLGVGLGNGISASFGPPLELEITTETTPRLPRFE